MHIELGKVKVVVINGTGTSGKNTFVDFVKEVYLEEKVLGKPHVEIYDISTVDKVKEFATQIFGWNGEKDERSRRMLSDLKDTWSLYSNGPLANITKTVVENSLINSTFGVDSLFFIHCREPEEIAKLVKTFSTVAGSCKTLLINRPDTSVKGNHADENVADYEYDIVIQNDSDLKEFRHKAEDFLRQIDII